VEVDGILGFLFSRGIRLEALRDSGAVFFYPTALQAGEWVALEALKNARMAAQEITINTGAQEAVLERAVRRRN
jgi:hypothetical protein